LRLRHYGCQTLVTTSARSHQQTLYLRLNHWAGLYLRLNHWAGLYLRLNHWAGLYLTHWVGLHLRLNHWAGLYLRLNHWAVSQQFSAYSMTPSRSATRAGSSCTSCFAQRAGSAAKHASGSAESPAWMEVGHENSQKKIRKGDSSVRWFY
jgi:hypothetical protein